MLGCQETRCRKFSDIDQLYFAVSTAKMLCMDQLKLPSTGKTLLTLKEAARLTGISQWTLRRDVIGRRLACFRRGRRGKIMITPGDLEAYIFRGRQSAIGE